MALIGTAAKVIKIKIFIVAANNWETDFSSSDSGYASQGFDYPVHTVDNPPDWVNRPTGSTYLNSLVMAFPRSAEKTTPTPPASGGWKVHEA